MKSYFLTLSIFLAAVVNGQIAKYSNEFLNIGVGARALGMGNTGVASTTGAYAGYWNPAGLLQQKSDLEVALMHAEYFAGIAKYDFIGLTKRIDSNSVAGLTMLRFGVDNIPNTLDLVDANGNVDYSKIKTFNAVDFAALLSYARVIPQLKGIELGGNFKIIRRKLGEFGGAWGFGLDAGIRYNYKGWQFGALGRDITGTFNAWSYNLSDNYKAVFQQTGNEIPTNSLEVTMPKLILGSSKTFFFWKERISVLGELNLINTFDGERNTVVKTGLWSMEPALGGEVGYKGFVFLRFGMGNIQKQFDVSGTNQVTTFQPNIGVGIKYRIFSLDYALTDIGDRSIALYSNIFSLKIDFNKKTDK